MVNYLAPIDLEDEALSAGVIEKTVQMATGVEGAQIYLMTVVPGIVPGIDQRYAIRGEMHGSTDYPLQEWKDEAAKDLKIDHIVMGAHRPSLSDFLLGPNSARVARHAGCSVTVVRE